MCNFLMITLIINYFLNNKNIGSILLGESEKISIVNYQKCIQSHYRIPDAYILIIIYKDKHFFNQNELTHLEEIFCGIIVQPNCR